MSEADARIIIDKLLRESNWILPGNGSAPNVNTEKWNQAGAADYTLNDSNDFPLCVLEAKREITDPLVGKEQARNYAEALNCRFVILSNGVSHYLWDIEQGDPVAITEFPTQARLEAQRAHFNPPRYAHEQIDIDYIARTQDADFDRNPDYINEATRQAFIEAKGLRLLRDYQLQAVKAVQRSVKAGKDRFLLEMATGTGKTLTSCAIIKLFLRQYQVKRVLFLVDRIELETQAQKEFAEVLRNDYQAVIWKENRSDWERAHIVVSTIQSFISGNRYRKLFRPDQFGLVISDEAHRSLGARGRKVFEYFVGFKLGLTATPKDYLKSVDIEGLSETDPRQLEKRMLLDTYTTFGCENSAPTYRYALEDGVKAKHLVNPVVFDARSNISTALLSAQGHVFQGVNEEGKDIEELVTHRDFERKFFSENTNRIFCETFLNNAKLDPYTNEIGKTLVFCVSQRHATKITQILNEYATRMYPDMYNSDFAMQVTSVIPDSQQMTAAFRNNTLGGKSRFHDYYNTSRSRVCVTVGMMTTGYDCTDILNICMMRPIFSPSEFVQMKGRGTRRCDFAQFWMDKGQMPDDIEPQKQDFYLFDFFGNYEYFEEEFDYSKVLKLPQKPSVPFDEPVDPDPHPAGEMHSTAPDYLAEMRRTYIDKGGMRIDRELYPSFKKKVYHDAELSAMVQQRRFKDAAAYLKDNIWDKPKEYYTLEKLRKVLDIDRRLTVEELLLFVFDYTNHIPSHRECVEEEFDRFDKLHGAEIGAADSVEVNALAREVFEAYATDEDYRAIVDSKQFSALVDHPSGEAYRQLPAHLRQTIPAYIKQRPQQDLERLQYVG